jgi:class 3 adenylate cyclase
VPVSIAVLVVRWVEPRIRSHRLFEWLVAGVYLSAMLSLVAILATVPGGLVIGIAGIVLASMVGGCLFCQRMIPMTVAGGAGTIATAVVCYAAGRSWREIVSAAVFVGSGLVFGLVFSFFLSAELRQKHALELSLAHEKEQSDTLLKEILPRYVIQRIRDGADRIAESMSEVNIIFIDIVEFTAMSRKLAPNHLIEVLGAVFRSFDELCEQHGVTKIKTIGDAYMAASGAPEPSSASALGAVEFCLAAMESVGAIARRTGIPLRVRAGIATGAAISGVLSLKRPAYDLWGETVNLASRMENTTEPGKIQIAETTYWRVKDQFVCAPRGLVEVKGFGQVQTYVIAGRSQAELADERGTKTATFL